MMSSATLFCVLGKLDDGHLFVLSILGGTAVLLYAIYSVRGALETRAREHTKRELAAYVAEGSIRPDDAQKILASGSSDVEKTIADAVAWGTISPAKAEALIRSLRSDAPAPDRAAPAKG
ncbi:MAG: hypothetical protein AB7K52_12180 [Phycisphaerales bacterium]